MSRKHFSGLLVAAVVVALALALALPSRTGRDQAPSEARLFPGLAENVNAADRLSVTLAGGEVVATLVRGETQWTISELAGYPADWDTLRAVLAGLAEASIVETKTDNPEYHHRLGVEDIANAGAGGILLTLHVAGAEYAVIVGKAADSREGRYLRRADSPRSVLSDFTADVPRQRTGWADSVIADIASANVAEVEIIHPDRDRVLVRKASADDTDFTLENLPAGRELQSSWSANALGGTFAALDLEDVRPADQLQWEDAVLVRVLTFDGMEISAQAQKVGDENWLRLNAAVPFTAPAVPVVEDVTGDGVDMGAEAAAIAEGAMTEADARTALQAEVDAFNARVSGWAYRIAGYKYDAMTKRLDSLLKQAESSVPGTP